MGNCSSTGAIGVSTPPDSPTAPARLLASLSSPGGTGGGIGGGIGGIPLQSSLAADEAVDAAGRVIAQFGDEFDQALLRVMRRVRAGNGDAAGSRSDPRPPPTGGGVLVRDHDGSPWSGNPNAFPFSPSGSADGLSGSIGSNAKSHGGNSLGGSLGSSVRSSGSLSGDQGVMARVLSGIALFRAQLTPASPGTPPSRVAAPFSPAAGIGIGIANGSGGGVPYRESLASQGLDGERNLPAAARSALRRCAFSALSPAVARLERDALARADAVIDARASASNSSAAPTPINNNIGISNAGKNGVNLSLPASGSAPGSIDLETPTKSGGGGSDRLAPASTEAWFELTDPSHVRAARMHARTRVISMVRSALRQCVEPPCFDAQLRREYRGIVLSRLRHLDAAFDTRARDLSDRLGITIGEATRRVACGLPVEQLRSECERRAEKAIVPRVRSALAARGFPSLAARGAEMEARRQMDALFDGMVAGFIRGKVTGVMVATNAGGGNGPIRTRPRTPVAL